MGRYYQDKKGILRLKRRKNPERVFRFNKTRLVQSQGVPYRISRRKSVTKGQGGTKKFGFKPTIRGRGGTKKFTRKDTIKAYPKKTKFKKSNVNNRRSVQLRARKARREDYKKEKTKKRSLIGRTHFFLKNLGV